MMCKHYNTPQGCSYGAKCQFAHGQAELRQVNPDLVHQNGIGPQTLKNPLNYKIVKCKNFEKEGTCKYGAHCSFAHGDAELRNKTENLNQMQQISQIGPSSPFMFDYNMMSMGMPMPQPGTGYDLNQLNQMAMTGQFEVTPMMMGMGLNMPSTVQFPNDNNDNKNNP